MHHYPLYVWEISNPLHVKTNKQTLTGRPVALHILITLDLLTLVGLPYPPFSILQLLGNLKNTLENNWGVYVCVCVSVCFAQSIIEMYNYWDLYFIYIKHISAFPEHSYTSVLSSKLFISDICKTNTNIWT